MTGVRVTSPNAASKGRRGTSKWFMGDPHEWGCVSDPTLLEGALGSYRLTGKQFAGRLQHGDNALQAMNFIFDADAAANNAGSR